MPKRKRKDVDGELIMPPELAGIKLNSAAIPVLGDQIEQMFRRQLEQRLPPGLLEQASEKSGEVEGEEEAMKTNENACGEEAMRSSKGKAKKNQSKKKTRGIVPASKGKADKKKLVKKRKAKPENDVGEASARPKKKKTKKDARSSSRIVVNTEVTTIGKKEDGKRPWKQMTVHQPIRHGDWRDERWAGLTEENGSRNYSRHSNEPPSLRWVLSDGKWRQEYMSDEEPPDHEGHGYDDDNSNSRHLHYSPPRFDPGYSGYNGHRSTDCYRRDDNSSRYNGNASCSSSAAGDPNNYRNDRCEHRSTSCHSSGSDWRRSRYQDLDSQRSERPSTKQDNGGKMPEHLRWLHERWQRQNHYDGGAMAGGAVEKRWREEQERRNDFSKTALTGSSIRPNDPRLRRRYVPVDRRANGGRNNNEGGYWPGESRLGINADRWPNGQSQSMPMTHFKSAGAIKENRLLSFKEYLLEQRKDLNEAAAMTAYENYKLDYKKRELAEYFDQHRDEEWFLEKYHPILVERMETARRKRVQKRLDTFMQLLVRGYMEVPLDWSSSRKLRKLLDAVVVLLEGGDEGDIACLKDYDYLIEEKLEDRRLGKEEDIKATDSDTSTDDDDNETTPKTDQEKEKRREAKEILKKRAKDRAGKAPGEGRTKEEQEAAEAEGLLTEEMLERMQHARDYSLYVMEHEELVDMSDAPDNLGSVPGNPQRIGRGVFVEQIATPKPLEEMNLHRTAALHLRNIAPVVFRQDLVEMCRNAHGGFLRLHLEQPKPFGNYFRHAIVSFWYNANIKKILWKLRGTHLAGVPLIVLEHKDTERRIRKSDGLAGDRAVVLRDIHLCKNLIRFLDNRAGLWEIEEEQQDEQTQSKNPLLVNLDDCLAFHLHQLMEAGDKDPAAPTKPLLPEELINRDENLLRVLDRLILYLRIVHSVDFYGCSLHGDEDDLPRRFRVTTVRGAPYKAGNPRRLAEYIKSFESRLRLLFPERRLLAPEHVELLGRRSEEEAVERCISRHSITVDGGLSECYFCKKRFAALEFVRSHVEAAHRDRLEEAKWRALCFNAYLADPKRPFFIQNAADEEDRIGIVGEAVGKQPVQ